MSEVLAERPMKASPIGAAILLRPPSSTAWEGPQ
jgi:hypothetical protein